MLSQKIIHTVREDGDGDGDGGERMQRSMPSSVLRRTSPTIRCHEPKARTDRLKTKTPSSPDGEMRVSQTQKPRALSGAGIWAGIRHIGVVLWQTSSTSAGDREVGNGNIPLVIYGDAVSNQDGAIVFQLNAIG